MGTDALEQKLHSFLGDLLSAQGFVLVEITLKRSGSGLCLNVLADRPQGGISLAECGDLNRRVRQSLDENGIVVEQYVLEVSSPGLDRALKTREDFKRHLNRQAVFFLNDLVNGKCEWRGTITSVGETSVSVEGMEIPLVKINKAKPVI